MLSFAKWNGCGNDFVLIDNRDGAVALDEALVRRLCDRRRGVGADGVIALGAGLCMSYFNCDGSRASLCANGTRCCAAFARRLTGASAVRLLTDAGAIDARCIDDHLVQISMPEPRLAAAAVPLLGLQVHAVDTGVPHAVVFVDDVDAVDVRALGAAVRFSAHFAPHGANVNFVQVGDDGSSLRVRTYERGVEDETLACGTGVVASAVVFRALAADQRSVRVVTRGGDALTVDLVPSLTLTGGVQMCFEGTFWM